MKSLFLFFAVLFISVAAGADEADTAFDSVVCVRRCSQRFFNGRCQSYSADFCAPGPGVACIPHCVQRSFQGRCMNYGPDFCGIYPDCEAYCQQVSVNGQCLSYGADQCFSQ